MSNRKERKWLKELTGKLFGLEPQSVVGQFSYSTIVERDILLQEVFSAIEIEGFPDEWDYDYFMLTLFLEGKICICNTDIGVIPIRCGLAGINVWNRPTTCVIAAPVIGSFERTIEIDCALIKIRWDARGISDLLDLYSYLMASCDASIAVNMMNTKTTFIGESDTEAGVTAMKKMYEGISFGQPAVFRKNVGNQSSYTVLPAKQNYISDMIMETKEKIRNEWLALWGIKSANTNKKERLIQDEVDRNNDVSMYHLGYIINEINSGLDWANKLFGLNLHARRVDYDNAVQSGSVGSGNTGESSAS